MRKKDSLIYLALLGDPEVSVGMPKTGGYNQTVKELLEYFSNSSINIVVITNMSQYSLNKYSQFADNIKIIRIDFENQWESEQDLIVSNYEKIFKRVCDIIDSEKYCSNIHLIHSFYWLSGSIAAKIKEKYGITFIHTVVSLAEDKLAVGIEPHVSNQKKIELCFLSKAEIIFAITPQEMHTLVNEYNIPKTAIYVVGRSVSKNYFDVFRQNKELQCYDKELVKLNLSHENSWWVNGAFIYIGRIVKIKGIKQIIEAWIYAKKNYGMRIPLWLVGGTAQQISEMRKLILTNNPCLIEYEKTNEIIWWGKLDASGISTLMRKSKALIMHSYFEAGGRVIIEALSAGIPVIATPFGFAKDYIYHGYNGFITEFNNIEQLSKTMMCFSDQPYLSSVMGNAASSFMNKIHNNWSYYKKHFYVYNAFFTNSDLTELKNTPVLPEDLNSFKVRNCVTAFPYFSTERKTSVLSNIISKNLGSNKISPVDNETFHSDLYSVTNQKGQYYLKCFYHILTSRFTKVQYNDVDVISAETQILKSKDSTSYCNIADILYEDVSNLFYIIPVYCIKNEVHSFDVLIALWKESTPEDRLLELYRKMDMEKLEKEISGSDNLLINGLFCAEIAYRKLLVKIKLCSETEQKMQSLLTSTKAIFGLNYGKGILGHTILKDGVPMLLPTHSLFLGELGCDVALTFMQFHSDNILLWEKIKSFQNIISSRRLDLWLLLVIFSYEESSNYKKILNYLLDL